MWFTTQDFVVNDSVNDFKIKGKTKCADGDKNQYKITIHIDWMLHRAVEFSHDIAPIVAGDISCPIDQWRFIQQT